MLVFLRAVMSGEGLHLILNPAAGKGRAGSRRAEISSFLKERGMVAVWHETEGPGHAREIARSLPEDARVVAVGGDGTVHEVASACVGTSRVVGVLPAGSGNDYVKALGVGRDLGRALRVLAGGRVGLADTGEVNGRPFVNGLGIGFDAQVAEGVERAPSYLGGAGGYLWSVGGLLAGLRCYEADIRLDGREVRSKTILVAVALGTTYGALFRMAPLASLDDGLFDVIYSDEVSRTEVLRLIPRVLRGTHLKHDKMHFGRAREVEVNMEAPLCAHADGEMLEPSRLFRARIIPQNLRVMMPKGS